MPQRLVTLVDWSFAHYWNIVTGLFFAFMGYFTEMKGAFHVMFAAFILDIFLGIIASRSIKKEKFSMHKFFIGIKRMLISYALVMLLFAMDKEMHQHTINLADTAAWIITGFLIYSAADNGFQITGNKIFMALKTFVHDKVQENAGIDIDKSNDQPSQKA